MCLHNFYPITLTTLPQGHALVQIHAQPHGPFHKILNGLINTSVACLLIAIAYVHCDQPLVKGAASYCMTLTFSSAFDESQTLFISRCTKSRNDYSVSL